MRFKRHRRSAFSAINLTSLIDVLCVLVIFFMLTTKYMSYKAIELSVGGSQGGDVPEEAIAADEGIKVQVLRHSRVNVDGLKIPVDQLSTFLKPRLLREPDQDITVTSSKGVIVQDVVSAIDQVRLAGGTRFTIAEAN